MNNIKKFLTLTFVIIFSNSVCSQNKNFDVKYYGFVRGEVYCDSRNNTESVDGLFYLFPADKSYDSNGKDLNAVSSSGFYTLATRLGLDFKGPDVGKAHLTAKIEGDFGGTTNMNFMFRMRQAYVRFNWDDGSILTLGQTWHPLFGEVAPIMLNLSTGAPFQPFNRSPQFCYQYKKENFKLTTSALYQLIYTSIGPNGKSEKYLKNGILPELYAGADISSKTFLFGGGADLLSLKPRLQSAVGDNVYKVNERITSLSYDLHAKYSYDKLTVTGKTVLASNLTHMAMIGGYGVYEIDNATGEQKYVPFRHSTSWLNIVYGKKYQGSLFAGYTKSLGTSKNLVDTGKLYGTALNIDHLLSLNFCFKYILPHWNAGIEYNISTARYGDINLPDGKVKNTHDVTNHRIEGVFIYLF